MAESEKKSADTHLTPGQERLSQLWEEHVRYEFATRNAEDTLATMVEDAYVNHIPVLTGGSGQDELREFYSRHFIPQMPPDTEMTPVSRTIGEDQIVDEMVFKFTHTIPMDWILPGIPPTGKRVEVPLVAIVRVRNGKVAHEHIYWDQASVLVQIGLLDPARLPVVGMESGKLVALSREEHARRGVGGSFCRLPWSLRRPAFRLQKFGEPKRIPVFHG